jgi:hypothetical protein
MNALHIDTLKLARKLATAGLDRGVAEALADGIGEIDTSDVATKADIAELKTDLAEIKSEILKWMFGQTLLILGVVTTLLKFSH